MNDWMTLEEAARHLNITTRTLRSYFRIGILNPAVRPGLRGKWLRPSDVRLNKEEIGRPSPMRRQEVLAMQARMTRLENQVAVLLRLLDAKDAPLAVNETYARELHATCQSQLEQTNWDLATINGWAEVFLRVDETDLETMARAAGDARPWVPFLRLCLTMNAHVPARPEYAHSLVLQETHRLLAEGRRRLRAAATCYEGLKNYTAHPLLADVPISVLDVLERVVGNKKK